VRPIVQNKFSFKELKRAINLLSKSDRKKIGLVTLLQVFLGIMDLIGVALIGIVSALVVRGLNSAEPGDRVSKILQILNLYNSPIQKQIIVLSITAIIVLILKTVLSVFFLRKTLFYLSKKSAYLTTDLSAKLLNKEITFIQKENLQQRLFTLTTGVSNITVGVLSNLVIFISDFTLMLILMAGLLIVDPLVCISTILVFGFVGLLLYFLLHTRATRNGIKLAQISIDSNNTISEAVESYREITVHGVKSFYVNKIKSQRLEMAKYDAELKFLPSISKYVTELTIVIGITFISLIQFSKNDVNHSVAVVTVFLAASTRIAPAVMRLQQSAITIKSYLGSAAPSLDLADELKNIHPLSENDLYSFRKNESFVPSILVKNLNFQYEDNQELNIENVNLRITPGQFVAFVGPSGGGKSTLVDLILGILKPTSGEVLISEIQPETAIKKWPGAIGFVPQVVHITSGTIKENICQGFDLQAVPEHLIWDALDAAQLSDFVNNLDEKLSYSTGDKGSNLSGGQRQRIGIARALLTQPKIVVLDEATSALDAETENRISSSIMKLKGNCTVIVVAHRLSTIKNADMIHYVDSGKIVNSGTFDELQKLNSDFAKQAQYMVI